MSIAENIARVRERIAAAVRRAQRSLDAITLMAVSKTFPPDIIQQAYDAGLRIFGENRVQEFAAKADAVQSLTETEWHLIGHLQSNKASKAVELFTAIDSVDSLRLAEKLNASAQKLGKTIPVLIEINIGGEDVKTGVAPESPELESILQSGPRFPGLEFRGLMAIPPFTEDPQGARPYFRKLRSLHYQIAARKLPSVSMDVLSMGMSHDFEVAIEEGSTCVRIGSAIFGARSKLAA